MASKVFGDDAVKQREIMPDVTPEESRFVASKGVQPADEIVDRFRFYLKDMYARGYYTEQDLMGYDGYSLDTL